MRPMHGIHGRGGLVSGPRWYELTAAAMFAGRRRSIYDRLVELSNAVPGDRVLDVGCGPGYLSRRMARRVGPDGYVEGIDPATEAVGYAIRSAPANASFTVATAERLPHGDHTFDVVLSSLAVHHIDPDRRAVAFAEMRRVLRPGGRLLIVELRQPRGAFARSFLGRFGGRGTHGDIAGDLPGLLTEAGFAVTDQGDLPHWLRYVQAKPEP